MKYLIALLFCFGCRKQVDNKTIPEMPVENIIFCACGSSNNSYPTFRSLIPEDLPKGVTSIITADSVDSIVFYGSPIISSGTLLCTLDSLSKRKKPKL